MAADASRRSHSTSKTGSSARLEGLPWSDAIIIPPERMKAKDGRAVELDPFPDICGIADGCSPFFGAAEPKYSDFAHLRPIFVREHLRFLDFLLTDDLHPRR